MEDYSINGIIYRLNQELLIIERWIKTLSKMLSEERLSKEGIIVLANKELEKIQIQNTLKTLKQIK